MPSAAAAAVDFPILPPLPGLVAPVPGSGFGEVSLCGSS